MNCIIKFFTAFITKHFTSKIIEKIVIIFLGELVKRTDSDIDDKVYDVVFGKTKSEEK